MYTNLSSSPHHAPAPLGLHAVFSALRVPPPHLLLVTSSLSFSSQLKGHFLRDAVTRSNSPLLDSLCTTLSIALSELQFFICWNNDLKCNLASIT